MRIARELGLSVDAVDCMSTAEWDAWRAYFEIEPPLVQVVEIMLARVCQAVIAGSGAKSVPELDKLMPMLQTTRRLSRGKRNSAAEFVKHLNSTGKVRRVGH